MVLIIAMNSNLGNLPSQYNELQSMEGPGFYFIGKYISLGPVYKLCGTVVQGGDLTKTTLDH